MMKNILTIFTFLTFSLNAFSFGADVKSAPKVIRAAPPAPRISDAERQTELAKRRAAVIEQMADNSTLILMSAEPKNYAGNVDFMYRQENNLYYLTNLKQNSATLVLTKDGGQANEFLFLPKRSPAAETWNGKMYSREDANRISGVKTMIDAVELKDFLQALKDKKAFAAKDGTSISNAATIYMLLPEDETDGDGKAEYRRETEFAKTVSGLKIENARPLFENLRLIKSPWEIKLLQHAIDITTEAQMRSMAMVGKAKWEYEVQAEVEYTFRRRNADYWGYPSIVGCGPNATTLHYVESQGEVKQTDLMLMDVGAEYDHYTADVTRTYPVSGKFTREQAEIYNAVYDAQEAAAKKIKPGANFRDPAQAATESIKQSLTKLGLINAPNATYQIIFQGKPIEMPQYRLWFMHGWGHWLGMNVHDVGGDGATVLKEGMVMTNEPGIYIREDALDYLADTPANKAFLDKIRPVFEKYKNIGVRIEDDMLVTAGGTEWMTKNLPRKISEIEAFMAQASKEMNYTAANFDFQPTLATVNFDNFLSVSLFDWKDEPMNGVTIRRGWISSGKAIADSGLSHLEDLRGE
ncbi:MAG: aminopeptidase P N-terminal domain-containing protein [Pyrinomonadaceae bacterium]|nr:aminopeptidase P N-terminal domain-containing protein [Pyrinomonadaceae bacterium]